MLIDHVEATFTEPAGGFGWNFPVFFGNGGSYDVAVPFVRIRTPRDAYLYDRGGQLGNTSPRFGTVEIVGPAETPTINAYRAQGIVDVERVIRSAK